MTIASSLFPVSRLTTYSLQKAYCNETQSHRFALKKFLEDQSGVKVKCNTVSSALSHASILAELLTVLHQYFRKCFLGIIKTTHRYWSAAIPIENPQDNLKHANVPEWFCNIEYFLIRLRYLVLIWCNSYETRAWSKPLLIYRAMLMHGTTSCDIMEGINVGFVQNLMPRHRPRRGFFVCTATIAP